jgi:TolA-binding protein
MKYLALIILFLISCNTNKKSSRLSFVESEISRLSDSLENARLSNKNMDDGTREKMKEADVRLRLLEQEASIIKAGGNADSVIKAASFNSELKKDSIEHVNKLKHIDWETNMKINLARRGIKGVEADRYVDSIAVTELFKGFPPKWYLDMKKEK